MSYLLKIISVLKYHFLKIFIMKMVIMFILFPSVKYVLVLLTKIIVKIYG